MEIVTHFEVWKQGQKKVMGKTSKKTWGDNYS